ncbi:hypothetical protein DSM25558_2194 [Agrobacterium sp. DSM 25558]|uniref:hypothetical protein n=1 Tax=Agrobacterium sp. DSM 25558 TaxID=1907665 RepID=UPI0009725D8C|nr:hypothetical protein [Agrobacterium sp. DSM 25558]SCX16712.1 hypothetical protein DSM25558_2194 [Agrobacterium sp. DSM 25558]
MLLKKYRENKDALKQIGREALAESRRMGLSISAKDKQNEAKDRSASERTDHAPATVRLKSLHAGIVMHPPCRAEWLRQAFRVTKLDLAGVWINADEIAKAIPSGCNGRSTDMQAGRAALMKLPR